jgi:predicted alpha/beta hydrolase family esterase
MREKRQLLFVQGGGIGVHDDWDGKLVSSLQHELGNEIDICYPRMPKEGNPSYELWKPALAEQLSVLRDGAILVGHSIGGTVLIRLLAEQVPIPELSGIFFIATPFLGDGGWSADGVQFSPELGMQLPKDVPIHFYHGLADETVPPSHVELYARAVPQGRVHRLPGRDHQLNNDLSEVAAVILSI